MHFYHTRLFNGHKLDVIDLAWSKADFLLSASIDKTVRLWHVSRNQCLCLFQHPDVVTSVAFHPKVQTFCCTHTQFLQAPYVYFLRRTVTFSVAALMRSCVSGTSPTTV
jgi:WD40 repeat protein